MKRRKCLSPAIIEGISNILGDIDKGLTGSEIHQVLLQVQIDDNDSLNTKRKRLYNAFANFQKDGKFSEIEKANIISDVEIKVNNLKQEIEKRKGHPEIFKYCTAELLVNNYFHSVFEANKGLFQRIRDLSGCTKDGNQLIEEVFCSNPILIINNFQNNSEKNEHTGFCNILKGLCGMFRNTSAHEPKISWDIEEQDALDTLGLISYCHRRLDKAQKIR